MQTTIESQLALLRAVADSVLTSTATADLYPLSLHDALPISRVPPGAGAGAGQGRPGRAGDRGGHRGGHGRGGAVAVGPLGVPLARTEGDQGGGALAARGARRCQAVPAGGPAR